MPERSKTADFACGAAFGFLLGLIVKDLHLTTVVSYHGEIEVLVLVLTLLGGITWMSSLRRAFAAVALAAAALWLVVAWTPLTHWMARGLPREDPLQKADAVFVLSSGLQKDGELSTLSMSRLLRGLELLSQGWAPRLILSELPEDYPRYRDAACELMESLGLEHEVLTVGPVRTTRDEAVAVGALAREWGFQRVLVVTSPSHTRRASAALEAEGVEVVSVASLQPEFDYSILDEMEADHRLRSFRYLAHERVGLVYYRLRGWIDP